MSLNGYPVMKRVAPLPWGAFQHTMEVRSRNSNMRSPEEGAPPGAGLGLGDNANGRIRELGLLTQRSRNLSNNSTVIDTISNNNRSEMTLGTRTRTRIGTWNVRTLYQVGKLNQLVGEARRLKLEILGVSEARWTGFGEKKLATGEVFLYSGLQEENAPHEKGVGLLLSAKAYKSLIDWRPINERIITCRLKARFRNITIIQSYAPTENAALQTKEDFYDQLGSVVNSVHKKDILLLLGDFNAQIGQDNTELELVMGKQALGTMNINGELFTEFCGLNNLMIGGSLFPHRNYHKVTWISPDGTTENQIDHICINRKWRRSLEDVRNKRGADIGSDHHLVIAEVKVKIAKVVNQRSQIRKKFDVQKLKNPEHNVRFVEGLRDAISIPSEANQTSVEDQWNHVKSAFINTCDTVLGLVPRDRKPWMSETTWKKIEERREAKNKINANENKTRASKKRASEQWQRLEKEVKGLCRQDKRRWTNDLADEAEAAARNNDMRKLYETTRKLAGRINPTGRPVRDESGNLLTNANDQINRWFNHFQSLFNLPLEIEESAQFIPPQVPRIQRVTTSAPSINEIEKAINSMKLNKSPGIDQITSEMLRADARLSAQALHPIFKNIWDNETFPEDWLQGILIKVPKKGDLSICDNWRGIMLLCVPVKVFCTVILNRIKGKIDSTLRRSQAGFRAGRSCTDHINTLRIVIEQINEFQDSLHLVFVDFQKAFDTLRHNNIWEAMTRKGVPEKVINMIKAQYTNFKCRILHNASLSNYISIQAGVRQGCILSPLMFLIVLDEVLSDAIDCYKRGIQWTLWSNEHLEDLDFADDIAFLAKNRTDMQSKIDALTASARKVGLNINHGKTKSMTIGTTQASFSVNGNVVECVDKFTYLGSVITPDGGAKEDVMTRIRKAQGAFAQLTPIWRSNQLTLRTKVRIFNSNVKSVLLYGCETWLVTDEVTKKLQVFVNRCLRRILRIWWPNRITNEELHRRCEQEPIYLQVRRRKWGWIGHTLRRDADTICRQALDWNPQGSRRRGAPKRTWRRSLENEIKEADSNNTWRQIKYKAQNRSDWRNFVLTLCTPGTDKI